MRAAVRRKSPRGKGNALEDRGDQVAGPARQDGSPRTRDLQQAFDKLAEPSREAIVLVILEGMAYEQAAGVTGMPVDVIRSRLFRAREKLRRQMEAEPVAKKPGRPPHRQPRRPFRKKDSAVAGAD